MQSLIDYVTYKIKNLSGSFIIAFFTQAIISIDLSLRNKVQTFLTKEQKFLSPLNYNSKIWVSISLLQDPHTFFQTQSLPFCSVEYILLLLPQILHLPCSSIPFNSSIILTPLINYRKDLSYANHFLLLNSSRDFIFMASCKQLQVDML